MRKYTIIEEPTTSVKKVMMVEDQESMIMFLYDTIEDTPSFADVHFETLEKAKDFFMKEVWRKKDGEPVWNSVPDPLENCQEDLIAPVRVKGIDEGRPQWGLYERFVDGQWVNVTF